MGSIAEHPIINPKYTIWMDTIAKGRYEDTNEIYEDFLYMFFNSLWFILYKT